MDGCGRSVVGVWLLFARMTVIGACILLSSAIQQCQKGRFSCKAFHALSQMMPDSGFSNSALREALDAIRGLGASPSPDLATVSFLQSDILLLQWYLSHTTIDSRKLGIPSALPYISLRSAD